MPPPSILLICAHPALHRSRVNRRMIDAAKTLPHVHVHNLYDRYPDFFIDVANEKFLLEKADLIVFQFPIHWYSVPALLKQWMDVVLEYGWAYGTDGTALKAKDFLLATTTGGSRQDYQAEGAHRHEFDLFLPPLQQTAHLCGMNWCTPHLLFGAHQADEVTVNQHCQEYRDLLNTYPDWTPKITTPSDPIHHPASAQEVP